MNNNSIGLRIRELIDYFCDGNNSTFARAIDTSEANVRNYLNGRQPKFETLYAIAAKFDISCDWLIQGEGSMIKSEHISDAVCAMASEPLASYEKTDRQPKESDIQYILTLKDKIITTLEEQAETYKDNCETLRQDNQELRTDVRELRNDNANLRKEINRLREEQGKFPLDFTRNPKKR